MGNGDAITDTGRPRSPTRPCSLVSAACAWRPLTPGYYGYLSANVVRIRVSSKKVDGAGDVGSDLNRAVRAQGNFAEYVPFTFLLLFLAELNGAPTSWVHAAYTVLFASRVAHGTFGILTKDGQGPGRAVGFLSTLTVMVGAGLYNVRLRCGVVR